MDHISQESRWCGQACSLIANTAIKFCLIWKVVSSHCQLQRSLYRSGMSFWYLLAYEDLNNRLRASAVGYRLNLESLRRNASLKNLCQRRSGPYMSSICTKVLYHPWQQILYSFTGACCNFGTAIPAKSYADFKSSHAPSTLLPACRLVEWFKLDTVKHIPPYYFLYVSILQLGM